MRDESKIRACKKDYEHLCINAGGLKEELLPEIVANLVLMHHPYRVIAEVCSINKERMVTIMKHHYNGTPAGIVGRPRLFKNDIIEEAIAQEIRNAANLNECYSVEMFNDLVSLYNHLLLMLHIVRRAQDRMADR